jgi:hypothetical protein
MRVFILALIFALVLLPTLLILFAQGASLKRRIVWAIGAFVTPIIIIAFVQVIPLLTNNAPDAHQWERFAGVVLSGSGFVLPWVIFALFLHSKRGK